MAVSGERILPPAPQEATKFGFDTFLSPYTYRYGSEEMRQTWSLRHYWIQARKIWVAVAEVQQEAGMVTLEQVGDLKDHLSDSSVERILQIEKKVTRHDLVAAIWHYVEQAPIGGQILHQGMTSEDIKSNVETVQIHESLGMIRGKLIETLAAFAPQIEEHQDLVCMGWSHLQAAEPTTYGYRFAKYAQDLLGDLAFLDLVQPMIKAKGIRGAVGTSASFVDLFAGTEMTAEQQEETVMSTLGLETADITDQTYPRKYVLWTADILSGISQSVHNFATDIEILHSSLCGEVSEARERRQVGSSAMPWKRNPINTESAGGQATIPIGANVSAWITAGTGAIERSLRDSSGKREWLPVSFLATDEALKRVGRVMRGLEINNAAVRRNLENWVPFSATEIILNRLVDAGMDRQEGHELLRVITGKAYDVVQAGGRNHTRGLVMKNEQIMGALSVAEVDEAFDRAYEHVGNAPQKCRDFLDNQLYPAIEDKS